MDCVSLLRQARRGVWEEEVRDEVLGEEKGMGEVRDEVWEEEEGIRTVLEPRKRTAETSGNTVAHLIMIVPLCFIAFCKHGFTPQAIRVIVRI